MRRRVLRRREQRATSNERESRSPSSRAHPDHHHHHYPCAWLGKRTRSPCDDRTRILRTPYRPTTKLERRLTDSNSLALFHPEHVDTFTLNCETKPQLRSFWVAFRQLDVSLAAARVECPCRVIDNDRTHRHYARATSTQPLHPFTATAPKAASSRHISHISCIPRPTSQSAVFWFVLNRSQKPSLLGSEAFRFRPRQNFPCRSRSLDRLNWQQTIVTEASAQRQAVPRTTLFEASSRTKHSPSLSSAPTRASHHMSYAVMVEDSMSPVSAAHPKADALIQWFTEHGGQLSDAVQIAFNDSRGFHMRAVRPLQSPVVVTCPLKLTLSCLNLDPEQKHVLCVDSWLQPCQGKIPDHILTYLLLIEQRNKGKESPWHAYIACLPGAESMTTPLWFDDGDMAFLAGTSLAPAAKERKTLYYQQWEQALGIMKDAGVALADEVDL
jgi:hypothetical protein